jgi:deoxyribodipyrimidine photo-lyase
MAALTQFEDTNGKSESSYWIWFELLWRDYFRFLHCKYGVQLYRASGLSKSPVTLPAFNAQTLQTWSDSNTGEALIDAAMRELKMTGYLSNRLRQQVMSYWLHELGGDWRVAAAWLEAQLIDYDVYSNQGNCLYLAGLGTDPRGYLGGRWFDPQKQAKQHDADGHYRRLWSAT